MLWLATLAVVVSAPSGAFAEGACPLFEMPAVEIVAPVDAGASTYADARCDEDTLFAEVDVPWALGASSPLAADCSLPDDAPPAEFAKAVRIFDGERFCHVTLPQWKQLARQKALARALAGTSARTKSPSLLGALTVRHAHTIDAQPLAASAHAALVPPPASALVEERVAAIPRDPPPRTLLRPPRA